MLRRVRVKGFKAIRDSGGVVFGKLTVFVGNNGAGKSSLIEALETYQQINYWGIDRAMQRWHGMEHVLNKARRIPRMSFFVSTTLGQRPGRASFKHELLVESDQATNSYRIERDSVNSKDVATDVVRRDYPGLMTDDRYRALADYVSAWQFLRMHAETMGEPIPQSRAGGGIQLAQDGSNIADYLRELRELSIDAYEGIVQTMSYVLPYASDIQTAVSTELERKTYLQLSEGGFKLPGWMLSTGTLRMLALIALLRHPKPPPLVIVEEIENGLDPRSVHLIVEEIRNAVLGGVTQVIATTHSPYLLDLLKLDQIVLVSRSEAGEPKFFRPESDESLRKWSAEFSPGRLYTMGVMHEAAHQ